MGTALGVISVGLLLQAVATVAMLRLSRVEGPRPWTLLSVAMAMLAVRSAFSLHDVAVQMVPVRWDTELALFGATSLLLIGAVMEVRRGPLAPPTTEELERLEETVYTSELTAERALSQQLESELRFRAIFDQTLQMTWLLDEDGTLREANRAVLDFGGAREESLVGQPLWETPWWSGDESRVRRLRGAVRNAQLGETVRYEARIAGQGGLPVDVDFSVKPVRDPMGEIAFLIAEARDLTDRKVAEKQLEESEAHYRSLIESASDIVLVLDEETRVQYSSPSLERIMGYRRGKFEGRSIFELLHPEDRTRVSNVVRKAFSDPGELHSVQHRARHKDGEWRVFESVGRALEDGTFIINSRDVDDRVQLEAQLRQAQKMEAIGQLAGGISHDFNNLLTAILGYAAVLMRQLDSNSPLHLEASRIRQAGERAALLTRQLLAFSRRQMLQPTVVDLREVVTGIGDMLRRLLGERVRLSIAAGEDIPPVLADAGQLEQVVMNLAVNARDAMPQGGSLVIRTGMTELDENAVRGHDGLSPGRYVTLTVQDTGEGMDEETRRRVFEPFFTTKDQGKGTGLGLSTVYGIVKQSGGYVRVDSKRDLGTTFTVYLPPTRPRTERLQPSSLRDTLPGGSETVLVAEDEEAVRDFICSVLEMEGYQVLEAPDGETALALSEEHAGPVHLLVTDVVMPGMGGRALADELLARDPAIAVLFVSGYTGEVDGTALATDPASEFLAKPFTMEALAQSVRHVLDTAIALNGA